MAVVQHFQPGTVVVYREESSKRTLATVVSGPHEGGTYDLDCNQRVPPESLQQVGGGERVEYFSASLNNWIPSQVLRKGRFPGTFDLDCKEAVDIRRMRLPKGVAVSQQPPEEDSPKPSAVNTTPSAKQQVLKGGDHCFYKSVSFGWIPCKVVLYHPSDDTYDLDVKQRVKAEAMFGLHDGEFVEYHSATTGQWIQAKIVGKTSEPGFFDLDCKEHVDLRRIRPPASALTGNASGCAAHPPSPSASPVCASSAAGGDRTPPPPPPAEEAQAAAVSSRSPSKQQVARAELQRARWGRDPGPLRDALRMSVEAGLSRDELEPAERSLRHMEARADLQQATSTANVGQLRKALRAAESAGLQREELVVAERALAGLEACESRIQQARLQLQKACQGEDAATVEEALAVAARAGMDADELSPAHWKLRVLRAKKEVQIAVSARNARSLSDALQTAVNCGVPSEELESARWILVTLEAEAAQQNNARLQLHRAVQDRDPASMREAITKAANAGLPPEELEKARQALDATGALLGTTTVYESTSSKGLAQLKSSLRSAASKSGLTHGSLRARDSLSRIESLEADAKASAAQQQLWKALQSEDTAALRSAVDKASSCGLTGEDLDHAAHKLWALESRPAALRELRRCTSGKNVQALQAAIEAAAVVGASEEVLEQAQRVLHSLEAAEAQAKATQALWDACRSEDVNTLRQAIQMAMRTGVPEQELDHANSRLCSLETRIHAREELLRAQVAMTGGGSPSSAALLRSALCSAEAGGLKKEEMEPARVLLQRWDDPPTQPNLQSIPMKPQSPSCGTQPSLPPATVEFAQSSTHSSFPLATTEYAEGNLAPPTIPCSLPLVGLAPPTTIYAGQDITPTSSGPPSVIAPTQPHGVRSPYEAFGSLPPTRPGGLRSPYEGSSGSAASGPPPPTLPQGLTSPYEGSTGSAASGPPPPTLPHGLTSPYEGSAGSIASGPPPTFPHGLELPCASSAGSTASGPPPTAPQGLRSPYAGSAASAASGPPPSGLWSYGGSTAGSVSVEPTALCPPPTGPRGLRSPPAGNAGSGLAPRGLHASSDSTAPPTALATDPQLPMTDPQVLTDPQMLPMPHGRWRN